MPVYKNISNDSIRLEFDNVTIGPGETKTVYHFYNDIRLKKLDVKPYKVPFNISEVFRLAAGETKEFNVLDCSVISIIIIQGYANIHLNENPSIKPINLAQGLDVTLSNETNVIERITIEALQNSVIYIIGQSEDYSEFSAF